jgi:hypothetical protein
MARTKSIIVRVTEAERDSYHAVAALNSKALGEYVRYLLDRETILMNQPREVEDERSGRDHNDAQRG